MIPVLFLDDKIYKEIKDLEYRELKDLLLTTSRLNKTTWQDARANGIKKGGYEEIKKNQVVIDSVKNRLPNGIEKFIVFAFSKKIKMLGYKNEKDCFCVLHLDLKFTAYNHGS